ncbi:CidA/LrgA family protein [Oceanobacillus bengalensis]|uniref:CidA/LrgA family holin-like protein n=1 Tax=Oceanobacillus bengalensis TaxID=1435466 RepID=A0A494YSG5_9BACI|nr:CidA/LrgA family holin-like protein [Oceanobacillus bengalensis]RKQ12886.1 CidA/LrgA family holin-like protein [Oceanobacillus bengalensis]
MLKSIKIVLHICLLYILFQVGNWIEQTFHLFIPGSVIGMIILFILLLIKVINISWIEEGATFMIKHLTFFFIPVTVGIMSYLDLFRGNGIVLVLITIASTLLVMLSAGHVSQWMITRKEAKHD